MAQRRAAICHAVEVTTLDLAGGFQRARRLRHDRVERFGARIFRRDDRDVRASGGDLTHQSALLAVAQAGAAESDDDPRIRRKQLARRL